MQIKHSRRASALCGALALFPIKSALAAPQPPTPLGPGFNAGTYSSELKVTVFASGLDYPTSMQQYNGGILVGTTEGAGFYSGSATGHLRLLTDTNGDGVADQNVDLTPAGGLPGSVTSVRQAGNLLFVTSNVGTASPIISVLTPGATATSPFQKVGTINLGFSDASWEHTSYALATRPTPNQPGSYDLLFNLGSRGNDSSDAGNFSIYHANTSTAGSAVGLNNVQLDPESIYKTTVTYNGNTANFTSPVKVAGGLRNAAGIAIQPGTGDLYYEDNGMDGSAANGHPDDSYGNAAYSLDTLHKINQASIGTTVPASNFATDFYENTQPAVITHGSPDAVAHFAPFGPFNAADENSSPNESEGASEIAFAPANFPAGFNNGVFIGFHGQFDSVGTANEEHPVVYYDLGTGAYFDFIGTQEPDIGHLDGMLSTSNALFMADITDGSLFSPSASGAIYEVTAVPEPAAVSLAAAFVLLLRRRPSVQESIR
jgi:glucose/arabinose dehydrogenase